MLAVRTALLARVIGPLKLKDVAVLMVATPARTSGLVKLNTPLLLPTVPPTSVRVPVPKLAPTTVPLATVNTCPELMTKLTLVRALVGEPVLRTSEPEMAGEPATVRLPVPCRAVLRMLLAPVPLKKRTPSAPKLIAPCEVLATKEVPTLRLLAEVWAVIKAPLPSDSVTPGLIVTTIADVPPISSAPTALLAGTVSLAVILTMSL